MKSFQSPKSAVCGTVNDPSQTFIAKFVAPKKWKKHMITILNQMGSTSPHSKLLIVDLITIVNAIPEANFVEATLMIQPFKPQFIQSQSLLSLGTLSTTTETVTKAAYFQKEFPKSEAIKQESKRVTEQTLIKEFNRPYHPFYFLLNNICHLLELKYKTLIDSKSAKMTQIQKKVRNDIEIIVSFFKKASHPYLKLFKLEGEEKQQKQTCNKLESFLGNYVLENRKVRATFKKIMVYASRAQFQEKLESQAIEFPVVEDFKIPEEFQIDGCYFQAINSLMEFSAGSDPAQALQKLIELRRNILKDIDDFYLNQEGQGKDLKVCAEVQLEIIRFIIAKLRGWGAEIYAQLKFLELVYGDDQMGYKFEDASYIYAQLCTAYEIIGIE